MEKREELEQYWNVLLVQMMIDGLFYPSRYVVRLANEFPKERTYKTPNVSPNFYPSRTKPEAGTLLSGTPRPTIYKWMFQLDDEPSLYIENGWKSPNNHL